MLAPGEVIFSLRITDEYINPVRDIDHGGAYGTSASADRFYRHQLLLRSERLIISSSEALSAILSRCQSSVSCNGDAVEVLSALQCHASLCRKGGS